jgi:PBSX family phage terminase large subunit
MTKTQTIELWTPHEKQAEMRQSEARFKVAVCGRRFGKTMYAVNTLIKRALTFDKNQADWRDGGKFFYIAPTYRQGKMIAWDMLVNTVEGKLPDELVQNVNKSELFVEIGNGSRISIKGADKPDSLRGVGLDGVVMDEYADMKPNVFSEIIRPTLVDTDGWAIFIGTPKGFNHFYDLFMEAKNETNWQAFRFPSTDNPHVPDKEIKKEKDRMPADKFAQEYMAEFRKREGLVYQAFDRDRHVVSDKNRGNIIQKVGGLDFGYTNPTAFIVIHKNTRGEYFVEEEWYKTGVDTEQIGEYVKSYVDAGDITHVYADPAEPDRIEKLQNGFGIPFRDVSKSVIAGIDKVRGLIKQNKLYISHNCKNLINEFESYHYPEDSNSKLNKNSYEKPVKEDDHGLDALRYALFMHAPDNSKTSDMQTSQEFNLYSHDYV